MVDGLNRLDQTDALVERILGDSVKLEHHVNTESDQLEWDPERIDDDGYPLMDENGSTLVPVPREGPCGRG